MQHKQLNLGVKSNYIHLPDVIHLSSSPTSPVLSATGGWTDCFLKTFTFINTLLKTQYCPIALSKSDTKAE